MSIGNGEYCNDAFSCVFATVEGPAECNGQYSCAFSPLITNSNSDSNIDCRGSFGCVAADLINNTNANGQYHTRCHRLKSCSNVSLLYNNYSSNIAFIGELSCAFSTISINKGNLECGGDRCVANSIIIGGSTISIRSHLGAYNATFISTRNKTSYVFAGRESGLDATIICANRMNCTVDCYGDAL